jgi:hypothetical protein
MDQQQNAVAREAGSGDGARASVRGRCDLKRDARIGGRGWPIEGPRRLCRDRQARIPDDASQRRVRACAVDWGESARPLTGGPKWCVRGLILAGRIGLAGPAR